MWFQNDFNSLISRSLRRRPIRRRPPASPLRLEPLEDRRLLSFSPELSYAAPSRGTGSVVLIDWITGRHETVLQLPGFTRGWALVGPYAFVGLSKIRPEPDAPTDFWQRTHYGFRADNGHFLHREADGEFVLSRHAIVS
jgi:hypothetical protein